MWTPGSATIVFSIVFPFLWSKGRLVCDSGFFLRNARVFHFLLLSHDFAQGRLTLVQPDGLGLCGLCEGFEPRRGHDDAECRVRRSIEHDRVVGGSPPGDWRAG